MKIKFGAIVTDGRNKIGGHVLSKNRGGNFMRTKVTPSNPQSIAQAGARNRFSGLSQAWRSLTQAQRDAWSAAVNDYQRTDIFGDLKSPSGSNLYQRLNNVLAVCGVAAMATPPLPSAVPNIYVQTVTAAVGVPALSVDLNDNVPADTAIMLFATAPMSAGRNYVKSQFRLIAVLPAATINPYDALDDYVAKYGNTGEIGQKIFVKTVPVNLLTGQTGSAAVASVITTA